MRRDCPTGWSRGCSRRVGRLQKDYTYPFGAHVAVVEVDLETGDVRLLRHIAVDDCGRILNPLLVEGQVHGGLAQGIAQALFEEVVYDELGTPLTSNLTTYAMPAASDLPSFERGVIETPTPLNPLGAKGIGESATIGSTPAVVNAVRGRARAPRRPAPRPAAHARTRLARDPGRGLGASARLVTGLRTTRPIIGSCRVTSSSSSFPSRSSPGRVWATWRTPWTRAVPHHVEPHVEPDRGADGGAEPVAVGRRGTGDRRPDPAAGDEIVQPGHRRGNGRRLRGDRQHPDPRRERRRSSPRRSPPRRAAPGAGARFSADVFFFIEERQDGTIEVFESSAEDGSPLNLVSVPGRARARATEAAC